MANLSESSTWEVGIYQIETSDYVVGGSSGVSNTQAKQLANRTKFLKDQVDALGTSVTALQAFTGAGPQFSTRTEVTSNDVDPTLTSSHIGGLIRVVGTGNDITLMSASVLGDKRVVAIIFEAAGNLVCQGSDQINDLGTSAATQSYPAGTLVMLTSNGSNRFFVISKHVMQNNVPAGLVAHFATSTAPAGWLKADGSVVSRATYPRLFAAIGTLYGAGDGSTTFKLPDLRGEFIRGFDDGRGVDTGRVIGSSQDASKVNGHVGTFGSSLAITVTNPDATESYAINGRVGTSMDSSATFSRSHVRPRNVAMLACIKI